MLLDCFRINFWNCEKMIYLCFSLNCFMKIWFYFFFSGFLKHNLFGFHLDVWHTVTLHILSLSYHHLPTTILLSVCLCIENAANKCTTKIYMAS
jgi:hypothetical protein